MWFVALLVASTFTVSIAQQTHSFNVIISINGDIPIGSITDLKTTVAWDSVHQEVFKTPYYPGSLTFDAADYQKIAQRAPQTISISFYHTEFVTNKGRARTYGKTRSYEVEISPNFINQPYYLISFNDHAAYYIYGLTSSAGHVFGSKDRRPTKSRK
ncbi:hypothetical protein [Hymenobacter sp. AT01-02]|uniref:hypothetical protein n=1 Tax=Hymenobacter sp. AT01-02 TaxID=1571877 RepID=UPI0005F0DD4A|nr:hypothetical protein [Hymenobacter sp. AT01-02]